MSETQARSLPAWDATAEAVLDRLVDTASARCDEAKRCAVSLQEKLRGTANFAAVVLGLEINTLAKLSAQWREVPVTAVLVPLGLGLLVAGLVVATAGYRPLDEPGLGSLAKWRGALVAEGGTRVKAYLVGSYEDIHEFWKPLLKRYARLAATAQWLLASGLAATALASLGF
ncbi:MAG: hypothetical protein HYU66_23045 [Armatimonadetes bacterium]|nr:hypothetical protein [Armatimonadota bacterium]